MLQELTSLQLQPETKGIPFGTSLLRTSVILIATFLVYSNTFNVPFVFDDIKFIVNNPEIKDLAKLWPPSGTRWLGFLTFAVNYGIGGLDTTGYHVVNLAIHMLNALLVYLLVVLTFKAPYFSQDSVVSAPVHCGDMPKALIFEPSALVAFFSALLFACHPIQTQAVTYIWQRVTSLATMFYLLSLVMYIKARLTGSEVLGAATESAGPGFPHRSPRFQCYLLYAASLLSAVLAMKSKEIAFTLPFVIALYEFSFISRPGSSRGEKVRRGLVLAPFILTLIVIPLSLFGPQLGMESPKTNVTEELRNLQLLDSSTISRYPYLLTQFRVIVTYFRLLYFPVNQVLEYDYPVYGNFLHYEVVLSFALHSSLLVLAGYLLYASGRRTNGPIPPACGKDGPEDANHSRDVRNYRRLLSFGIFWFFITLSVESSIIPIKHVIFEHRLYLPSVGFFIALTAVIAMAGSRWAGARKTLFYSLVLLSIGLSVAAYARNAVWKDSVTLWEDVVQKSPTIPEAHNNLGAAYAQKGYYDRAVQEYLMALKISPDYQDARVNLTKAYIDLGRDENAIDELTALKANSGNPAAYNNLGLIYAKQGKIDSAINEFKAALKIDPDHAEVRYNLGRCYAEKGDIDAAIREYAHAVKANPDLIDAHFNLGLSYAERGQLLEGIRELREVLRLDPEDPDARGYLRILDAKVKKME